MIVDNGHGPIDLGFSSCEHEGVSAEGWLVRDCEREAVVRAYTGLTTHYYCSAHAADGIEGCAAALADLRAGQRQHAAGLQAWARDEARMARDQV